MAYSDYAGYAYLDGQRVPERSDCILTDAMLASFAASHLGAARPASAGPE